MKTSSTSLTLIPVVVLVLAGAARAQAQGQLQAQTPTPAAETVLPAIIPATPGQVSGATTLLPAASPAPRVVLAPPPLPAPASRLTSAPAPVHAAASASTTDTSRPAAVRRRGVVVNGTPTRPAPAAPPQATLPSENSVPRRDTSVTYYLPVGAISPASGIRTYPGNTAAHITSGATRVSTGVPVGSTFARIAGGPGSRAARPSTRATTVYTR